MKRSTAATGIYLLVSLTVPVAPGALATGIFEVTRDIGGDSGAGSTEFLGYAEVEGRLVGQYLMTGSGGDIWGSQDQFHFAYRKTRGAVRVSAGFEKVGRPHDALPDTWGRYGVMLRASEDGGAVNYFTSSQRGGQRVQHQWRVVAAGSTASESGNADTVPCAGKPVRMGIQRVLIDGTIPVVESIVDWGGGAGWERVGTLRIAPPNLPDEVLVGLAVTSGSAWEVAQAVAGDVAIETKPALIGPGPAIAVVPAAAVRAVAPTTPAGFRVRSVKATYAENWSTGAMNKLLDFGCTGPICLAPGMPIPGTEAGERVVQFVNLFDTGPRGTFSADDGYPDETYPGVDLLEIPAADPAAGDDDDNFATEAKAIVCLTAGVHIFGAAHGGSLYFRVGGVHIGAEETWDGDVATDFIFTVEQDGYYELNVRTLEGTGGAQLELHEVIRNADGTFRRILLGDAAHGGAPVFIP